MEHINPIISSIIRKDGVRMENKHELTLVTTVLVPRIKMLHKKKKETQDFM